jgi:tricorn protease
MDLASFESQLLFKEELWGFYNSDPQFAADDKHILLSAYRNFETDLFVYNLDTKIKQNLTQTGVSEAGPIWSPDGKYIYYNSNPTRPSYPYGMRNANLYRLPLEKIDSPFKSDEFDKLFEEEKEDKEEKETEKDADKEKEEKEEKEDKEAEKEKIIVQIDADQIMERSEQFAPSFGSQFTLSSIKGEDKEIVLFSSNHEGGDYALYKWEKEAFKKGETKKIAGAKGGSYGFASSDGKYYILNRGNIHTLDIKGNKLTKIDISLKFRRQLRAEFEQMYYETWANVEENFYDENFHGVNWTGLRDQYAQYLPFINNRADLRSLLNDLLGELNTSHFGFYSSGAEESNYYGSTTLSTGIQFRTDQPYIVDRIIQRSPADKKGKDILPGDELVAINGQALDKQQNRNFYFTKPSMDEEVELTFKRMGKEIKTKLHPISYFTQRNLLYDEWMAERQAIVDTKSNKKIAYVHMKNMGGGQLNHFLKQMVSEAHHRDALILDLRYNTGGNVHDEVLKFLSQKPYLQWKYREGALTPQSNFIPGAKPIVLLINEQSLSDAEMTATGFKALKLGTIMGTETYRWIIFTSGKGLVDGSFYRLPSWGCYTLDGKNIEKTGVAPDIVIKNTFKDRLEGKDPQLDRAIGHILKELQ